MSRKYLIFGSDDGAYWELLNTVEASGSEQALNIARKQESHRHYGATPERNWTAMTPEVVERAPVVKWKPLNPQQMSVEDVLADEEVQEGLKAGLKELREQPQEEEPEEDILERARGALARAKGEEE